MEYHLTLGISESYSRFVMKKESATKFKITCINEDLGWMGEFPGIMRPKISCEIN
jgi:hypothetical protein